MAALAKKAPQSHAVFTRWRPLDQNAGDADEIVRTYESTHGTHTRLLVKDKQSKNAKDIWDSGTAFSKVFESDASNEDVFQACVAPVLPRVLEGTTCNFFAYGHTGSGKTYTITGNPKGWTGSDSPCLGLCMLAAKQLFEQIGQAVDRHPTKDATAERIGLGVRLFEIRGSKAYDLQSGRRECYVRQGEDGKTHIRGETELLEGGKVRVQAVTQTACWAFAEVLEALQQGLQLRSTGTSTVHDQSSRTHAILEMEIVNQHVLNARDALVEAESELVPVGKTATDIYIEEYSQSLIKTDDGGYVEDPTRPVDHARIAAAEAEKKVFEDRVKSAQDEVQKATGTSHAIKLGGKVIFADLAGAEFYSAFDSPNAGPKQTPQERQEGRQINTDLLALKEVIRAWSARKAHIPFRSSTLTMVLREHFIASEASLSGTILTVSSAEAHLRATLNTLKYGKVMGEVTTPASRTSSSVEKRRLVR
ncbi:hypothetical protein Q7P37_000163 [Cladosporium fusiforme]